MSYYVYKHTFPNGKVYIGITCQKPEDRWNWGSGYYKQPYLYNAIKKYGWNNIEHDILFDNLTKEEAEQKEIELISLYQSNKKEFGYNISNGGSAQGKHSNESKQKMSESLKKTYQKRRQNGQITMFFSEEHRRKLSEANKKRVVSNDTRRKQSDAQRQRYLKNDVPVRCVETGVVYSSASDASIEIGISTRRNILLVCNGERKTAGGYHWKFANDNSIDKEDCSKTLRGTNRNGKPVRCIETNVVYDSAICAQKETGIHHDSISKACRGVRKMGGGYHWEFVEEIIEESD